MIDARRRLMKSDILDMFTDLVNHALLAHDKQNITSQEVERMISDAMDIVPDDCKEQARKKMDQISRAKRKVYRLRGCMRTVRPCRGYNNDTDMVVTIIMQDTKRYIDSLWKVTDEEGHNPPDGKTEIIGLNGKCHDCGCDVTLFVTRDHRIVDGAGGLWHFPNIPRAFVKCGKCLEKDEVLRNYQPCEIYSRVVGYLRPVNQWNEGKKAEFRERVNYDLNKMI
jgi:hypothetical protein